MNPTAELITAHISQVCAIKGWPDALQHWKGVKKTKKVRKITFQNFKFHVSSVFSYMRKMHQNQSLTLTTQERFMFSYFYPKDVLYYNLVFESWTIPQRQWWTSIVMILKVVTKHPLMDPKGSEMGGFPSYWNFSFQDDSSSGDHGRIKYMWECLLRYFTLNWSIEPTHRQKDK